MVCGPGGDFEMKIGRALAGIDARSIESDLDRYRQGAGTYAETCAARANLERVFRIERKRVVEEHAAACTDGQAFDVTWSAKGRPERAMCSLTGVIEGSPTASRLIFVAAPT